MSDYTQITFFAPKDALPSGNPSKLIKGVEVDPELSAIAAAIASKYDGTDIASDAEAAALSNNSKLVTPAKLAYALTNGAHGLAFAARTITAAGALTGGGDLSANRTISLDIPGLTTITDVAGGSDVLVIYDTSVGAYRKVTVDNAFSGASGSVPNSRSVIAGSGLSGGGSLAADRTFALDGADTRNVNHSSVSISASTGLTGGGDITASRSLAVDRSSTTNTTAVGYLDVPDNQQSSSYGCVIGDRGKLMIATAGSVTFTIPANGSVAYPIGTVLSFTNTGNACSIAITTDTMYLAGTATTGTRSLAARGLATAVKIASTTWIISGTGLT